MGSTGQEYEISISNAHSARGFHLCSRSTQKIRPTNENAGILRISFRLMQSNTKRKHKETNTEQRIKWDDNLCWCVCVCVVLTRLAASNACKKKRVRSRYAKQYIINCNLLSLTRMFFYLHFAFDSHFSVRFSQHQTQSRTPMPSRTFRCLFHIEIVVFHSLHSYLILSRRLSFMR